MNGLVPGGKEMAILSNVKVIFFCVAPYDRHLYTLMINDSIRCEFDFECDCAIGNVTLASIKYFK